MTNNRIAAIRQELKISQRELIAHLPDDINPVAMSFIEQGRVLPNVPTMAALADTLGKAPTEIYAAADLNLTLAAYDLPDADGPESTENGTGKARGTTNRGRGKEGMVELRCWAKEEEKRTFDAALNALGYSSYAEWWREKYRATLRDFQTMLRLREGK